MIAVYCPVHKGNEQFSPNEVERMLYVLHGSEQDEWQLGRSDPNSVEPADWCFKAILQASRDIEQYGEYVTEMVSMRVEAKMAKRGD